MVQNFLNGHIFGIPLKNYNIILQWKKDRKNYVQIKNLHRVEWAYIDKEFYGPRPKLKLGPTKTLYYSIGSHQIDRFALPVTFSEEIVCSIQIFLTARENHMDSKPDNRDEDLPQSSRESYGFEV